MQGGVVACAIVAIDDAPVAANVAPQALREVVVLTRRQHTSAARRDCSEYRRAPGQQTLLSHKSEICHLGCKANDPFIPPMSFAELFGC
jgi:hypothetical protein